MDVRALLEDALAHHRAGRLSEAQQAYRQVLQAQPDCADALHLLGLSLHQCGRNADALPLIDRAVALDPQTAMYHNSRGVVLHQLGRFAEAIAEYRRALDLRGDYTEAMINMGMALAAMGRPDGAVPWYRRALEKAPDNPSAHMNLGNALYELGDLDGAADAQQRAIRANPADAQPHNNLGIILQELSRHEQARQCFRRAMQLAPDWPAAHSNLLLSLHYDRGDRAQELYDEHRAWAAKFAEPLRACWPRHARRDPSARIRVGYVSADFCAHPVGFFIAPLLTGHDRDRFEILCYADVSGADWFTERLKAAVEHWRPVNGLSDEQLARLVMEDRIDILVDLAGHTAGNRLMAFARKPARVQVTYLGYPDTTGMSAMDWRFTDARCDPSGAADACHSERLFRLDGGFLCYSPPEDVAPPAPLPALRTGCITFGSFNNLAKTTPRMLGIWARILLAVSRSRLVLKCRGLNSAAARESVRQAFAAAGVEDHRVELLGPLLSRTDHLRAYDRIDIALDTFPYCGTTTTCEALWMGVPVITLAGPTHVSRVGASLLAAAGLDGHDAPALVAADEEQYVALAVRLAEDVESLSALRAQMRQRMLASALCDRGRLVKAVESAYQRMLAEAEAR